MIEITPAEIGQHLAAASADVQAEVLNVFGFTLLKRCGSRHKYEAQISWSTGKLDQDGKNIAVDLGEFAKEE